MTFDLLDADRMEVDPSYVPDRVTLIFFRPRGHRWWTVYRGARREWPMLVVMGYRARADRYDQHWADFDSLVGRTRTMPLE